MTLQQNVTIEGAGRQSRAGIERALTLHAGQRRIRFWTPALLPHQDGHRIGLTGGTVLVTRSLRESALAALVLAGAAQGTQARAGMTAASARPGATPHPPPGGSPAEPGYGDECVIELASGAAIRTDSLEASPGGCSYVRVCRADGTEIAYWSSTEWQEDPQLVMAAILGAARISPHPPAGTKARSRIHHGRGTGPVRVCIQAPPAVTGPVS